MKHSPLLISASSLVVLGVAALGLSTTSAFAVTTVTASMGVSATVQSTCVISATPMGFGTYAAVVNNATSTVAVTCTNTTPYTVSLNAGAATGATVTNRSMTGGAVLLNYALYSDSARSANFTTTASLTGNGSSQPITIYGQIPGLQYVAPGTYTDTIIATVTY